eukprot:CAMPEP_0203959486 /NCGR_PEP_ID=MMETSP0359-20131031/90514_1 /ASSEMBLY_ACC=CAM_ASM_000338 /TAXON_ID=268821 /ORGANISM="Scrippsiella Hangoei, Strain SHTV-5" /LENGTH=148 /DNA_ID=CAMNT_0050893567 /DNA_START=220 /DNA_END=667 /DNA_ORIENTATION=-
MTATMTVTVSTHAPLPRKCPEELNSEVSLASSRHMWLHCGVEKFGLMEQERPEDPERRGRPDAGAEEFANESSSGTEDEPSLAYAGRRRATRGSAHGRRDYTLISRKTMAEEMPLRQKRRIAQCVCASDRLQRRALRSCGQEQQSREH